MTVKLTYNEAKETFGFKGLEAPHLIAILKLVAHVRMGGGALSKACSEIAVAYDESEYGGDLDFLIEDSHLAVIYDLLDGSRYAPLVMDAENEIVGATLELTTTDELENFSLED